jgi:WD40 repeat protein
MARRRSTGAVLIVAVALVGTAARAETSDKGLLRVTATWGDDRFVPGWASETVVSSDGRRVAVSTVGGVIIWDLTGGAEVRIPMPASPYRTAQLAFGPGDRVLVTAQGGELAGWDVATGRKLGGAKPAGFERPTVALAPGTSLAALWEFDSKQGHRLEVWDAQAGKRVREIQTPSFGVSHLIVTLIGNGRRVFVRAPDTQDHTLFDVADGKVVFRDRVTGTCESSGVCAPVAALLAPDGRTLVRAFAEPVPTLADLPAKARSARRSPVAPGAPLQRRIELVDLDGDRVTVLEKPPVGIDFALAADGRSLACAASEPGQIAIWDLGRRVRRTVKLAEPGASRLTLSSQGKLLLVGGDTSATESWLSLYRASDGRRLWHNPHVVRRERVQPRYDIDDGAGLVICSEFCPPPDEVRTVAWDAATGNRAFDLPNSAGRGSWFSTRLGPLFPAPGLDLRASTPPWPSLLPALRHAGGITHLAVSRDGKWLAEAGDDGLLLLRNLADPTQLVPVSDREGVQDLAFLPDRDAIAVVYYQRAAIWDLATRKIVAETKADKDVAFGRLLPGGHRFAADINRRTIEIRSLDDGRRIETLTHPCGPEMPGLDVIDLSGAGLCATYEREDKGILRALRTGAPRARYKTLHGLAQAVAVSKDGARALVSHHSGQVILVALGEKGRVVPLTPLDDVHTPAVAFSPDGRRALTASIDGVLRLWDTKTGALLDGLSMAERIDYPRSMTWTPDGRTLFVGTARGLVYRIEDGAK